MASMASRTAQEGTDVEVPSMVDTGGTDVEVPAVTEICTDVVCLTESRHQLFSVCDLDSFFCDSFPHGSAVLSLT